MGTSPSTLETQLKIKYRLTLIMAKYEHIKTKGYMDFLDLTRSLKCIKAGTGKVYLKCLRSSSNSVVFKIKCRTGTNLS